MGYCKIKKMIMNASQIFNNRILGKDTHEEINRVLGHKGILRTSYGFLRSKRGGLSESTFGKLGEKAKVRMEVVSFWTRVLAFIVAFCMLELLNFGTLSWNMPGIVGSLHALVYNYVT